jgi:glycosyltransferase involved in cell wall biosynthesis
MPCYNQSKYVQDAINSVINQTYANWELIIVNDGSTDNSKNVIQDFIDSIQDDRISLFNIANNGVSYARNYAIEQSSGKYILPLDADDIIHTEFIAKAIKVMESEVSPTIVYSDVEFIGAKKGKLNTADFSYKNILLNNIIVCTALFKRTDFDKTNGYDASFINGWEDWDFWLSLLRVTKKPAFKIPETLFYYRIKQNSRNQAIDNEKRWQNDAKWKIFMKHTELYKEFFDDPISILKQNDKLVRELIFFKDSPIKYLVNKNKFYTGVLSKFKAKL